MPILDLTNRKSADELEKLPKPTNQNLKPLFQNIDKVVIKEGGVYQNKAISDAVVLTISRQDDIQRLENLLEIDESLGDFYCLCHGDYAIELQNDNQIQATIGFHHGISIRYDNWKSDAGLLKSDDLLSFLAELGLSKPLEEKKAARERALQDQEIANQWISNMPPSFTKYWDQMQDFDESYFTSMLEDFEAEEPDQLNRINKLLELFGSSRSPYSGTPLYESIPETILQIYPIAEIIQAYQQSNKSDNVKFGLGRYICSFRFRKKIRKKLKHIPLEVFNEIELIFEPDGDINYKSRIAKLKQQKITG